MTAWLELLRSFVLRGFARERARTAVALLGVTIGVAVLIAIRLANRSALDAFRTGAVAAAGHASLSIEGAAGPLDERRIAELLWLWELGRPAPVVEGDVFLPAPGTPEGATEPEGEYLRAVGVDILRDRAVRDWRLVRFAAEGREPTGRELLDILLDPDAVVVPARLARRRGLEIGDRLRVLAGDRPVELEVRGLLTEASPGGAAGGLVLLDIAAAQALLDRYGVLDRIDLRLPEGLGTAEARERIAARLPEGLVVREPSARVRQTETMIASYRFNLAALGSLALIVGLYLVGNTVSFSVLRRRREIGRLRAAGASRRLVLALFLGEALCIALPGAALGVLLGRVLAEGAVRVTARTVETFYVAETARQSAGELALGAGEWLLAFGVAVPLALLAAWLPARGAARVPPAATERDSAAPPGARAHIVKCIIALAFLAGAGVLGRPGPVGEPPVGGYAAALCVLGAASFLVPPVLAGACALADRLVFARTRGLSTEGLLATSNLTATSSRVAVSAAALAASLAMTVAIAVMVGSFRETVVVWLDSTLGADLYVRPASRTSARAEGTISPEAVDVVRSDPAVERIDRLLRRRVPWRDRRITVAGRSFADLAGDGTLPFQDPPPEEAYRRIREHAGERAVVISESLARRAPAGPGERIELPTRHGARTYEVLAVYPDYSDNQGVAILDTERFRRDIALPGERADPSGLAVHLAAGTSPEAARRRIARSLGREHRLVVTTARGVRERSLEIFESTFAVTDALLVIAVTVAAMGVVATLVTLLLERRRDFAVLRFLGATRRQVRRVVVIEALLLGLVSQAIALGAGVLLALVLVFVINVQSFGWTLELALPWGWFAGSTGLVALAALAAGLEPARRAAAIEPARWMQEAAG